jgi:Cupredoxin-like domain
MSNCSGALNRRHILAVILLASAAALAARGAQAEDAVSLSLTIKDGKFEPAELHAPAGRALEIHVTNLNTIPSEFESSDLHFEKIVGRAGGAMNAFAGDRIAAAMTVV